MRDHREEVSLHLIHLAQGRDVVANEQHTRPFWPHHGCHAKVYRSFAQTWGAGQARELAWAFKLAFDMIKGLPLAQRALDDALVVTQRAGTTHTLAQHAVTRLADQLIARLANQTGEGVVDLNQRQRAIHQHKA